MRRAVHDSARRADAAAFTREGDEDLVGAGLAADAGEAVGKEATAQVGGELAVDVAGQAATVGIAELGEQDTTATTSSTHRQRPGWIRRPRW